MKSILWALFVVGLFGLVAWLNTTKDPNHVP